MATTTDLWQVSGTIAPKGTETFVFPGNSSESENMQIHITNRTGEPFAFEFCSEVLKNVGALRRFWFSVEGEKTKTKDSMCGESLQKHRYYRLGWVENDEANKQETLQQISETEKLIERISKLAVTDDWDSQYEQEIQTRYKNRLQALQIPTKDPWCFRIQEYTFDPSQQAKDSL